MVATPFFGWLCDSAFSPWVVSASGSVLIFLCFGLIGSLSLFHLFLDKFLLSVWMGCYFRMSVPYINFGLHQLFNFIRAVPGPVIYFPFFEASFGSVSGSLVLQGAEQILFTHFYSFFQVLDPRLSLLLVLARRRLQQSRPASLKAWRCKFF